MRDLSGYEIRGLLGAGGMGEVHRAYDRRLGREVAIKRLPPAFTTDPDRLARFEREARVLASLNHPNIAAIYGIEDTSSDADQRSCALILELVEGPTLADRLGRGPLKIAEATDLALQIARALEAAHESGIVHRDLKPANIKITSQGRVKVLDFGLATPVKEASTTQTAFTTVMGTQPGAIMGTPSYMSPEQVRGLALDPRTDIWAFGCVLFEMLTGTPAFPGATTSDVVARVLERDPDWATLPSAIPDGMRRVVRWALAKDVHDRLRHIGDAILELESAVSSAPRHDTAPAWRRWPIIAALVAAAVVGTIIGAVSAIRWRPAPVAAAPISSSFTIAVGPSEVLPRLAAISPDGRYIAYIAGPSGNQRAYLRRVGDRQSRVLAELPLQSPQPFFSPDSQWVGYFDAGKLKKAPVSGGPPMTLADAPTPRGGTWVTDGSIVFAPISRGGLMMLPATGGAAQALTTPDSTRGETSHRNPAFAPGSDTVFFLADGNGRSVQAVSLRTKKVTVLFQGDGVTPRYLPTGHLAYLLDQKLMAVSFDLDGLRITGSPFTVVEGAASFSFSDDGTLIYSDVAPSNILASTPVWVSRDGSVSPLPLRLAEYDHPRLSPDGRSIVIYKLDAGDRNLWLYDIARDTLSKFTLTSPSDWPVWTGDGRSVVYGSSRAGTQYDIFSKPVDGSNAERTLLSRPLTQIPRAAALSADVLIFEETYADKPNALWRMSLRQPGDPQPLFDAPAGEMMPTLSPDGRWMGYVSSRSGRNEVYVRPASGTGSTSQISNEGGVEPVWSRNGRELFYRENDKMVVVDVISSESPSFGKPRALFEGAYMFGKTEGQEFDVSPDGHRFLMLKPQQPLAATPLNVRVNWFSELRQR